MLVNPEFETLAVRGKTTLKGDLQVDGDFTLGDDVTIADTLTVQGATGLNDTLTVAGATRIDDTTASTSTTSGALRVAGGISTQDGLYTGTDAFINGVRVGRGGGNATANTVIGNGAMPGTGGSSFIAIGNAAAASISATSVSNVIVGTQSFQNAAQVEFTTAIGHATGLNITGSPSASASNVFIGSSAGRYRGAAFDTLTSCSSSICIGVNSKPADNSQTNQIVIGNGAVGNGSNTTTLGNSSTTGTFIPGGNLTLTNGNLILGTAGNGIDFSADANAAGMTSELLDDYEEGTWTPVFAPESGAFTTMTMDNVLATYTKVGRQVTLQAWIRTSNVSVGTASGGLRVSGLPFANQSSGRSSGSVSSTASWTGDVPSSVVAAGGGTFAFLYYRDASDGLDIALNVTDLTTGAGTNHEMVFAVTYFTA